ncbi:hypothetical protein BaRGS_00039578, partial [Batillaria attramentaria]
MQASPKSASGSVGDPVFRHLGRTRTKEILLSDPERQAGLGLSMLMDFAPSDRCLRQAPEMSAGLMMMRDCGLGASVWEQDKRADGGTKRRSVDFRPIPSSTTATLTVKPAKCLQDCS